MQKLPAILLGSGLLVAVLAIVVGWLVFPKIIESKISQTVRLVEGGETYKKWENLPVPVYMKIYIFNVTNSKDVLKGEKPKLQEVGPYVYQQKRVKTDIVIKEVNDTIFYRQIITYFFRPDMSEGTENDGVTVINLPYIGMAAKAAKMPATSRYVVAELMSEDYSKEPIFVDRTVGQLLFEGYHVPFMVDLASLSGEQLLPNNTFGMYYGKNGTDGGELEVFSGVEDNTKFGQIASWKNESKLDFWGTDYCNMINGSDGALFPPFVTTDRILEIFSPELCRSLYLTYENTVEILGLPGYRFTLPKILLENPLINLDNMCYCTDPGKDFENCPKGGVYSISSCRKGAPLAVSLPHFLDADPYYADKLEGMNPQREKHETEIILEPNTGVLLRASKRIQMNIELKPNKYFPPLKKLPTLTLPIVWVDESAALTDDSATKINGKLLKPQRLAGMATWAVFGIGCLLIVISVIIFIVRSRRKNYKP